MFYYYRARRRYAQWPSRILYFGLCSSILACFWLMMGNWDNSDNDDDLAIKNEEAARKLSSPRIFCLVLSANSRHLTSSKAIVYTWGKRCDRFYFLTRLQNTSIELMMLTKFENTSNVTSNNINQYTLDALTYLQQEPMFSPYDWFLRSGDDSFVIVPHLRKLVKELQMQESQYPLALVGDVETMYERYGISTSGSVMLFNRKALNRLIIPNLDNGQEIRPQCSRSIVHDHEFVDCLRRLDIRINPVNENLILSQNLSTYRMDLRLKDACCSPKTVAFRAINETDMYRFEFLYHRLDAHSPIETL